MSSPADAELMDSAQKALSPYADLIPSLSAKYFSRPPIKFLVSVVSALHKRTGFGTGVFSADQLSGNLPDAQGKLAFFATLRQYVGFVSTQTVDVSTRAIVRGLEVPKTLVFLKQIVHAAENPVRSFDSVRVRAAKAEAVQIAGEVEALRAEVKRLAEVVEEQRAEIAGLMGAGGAGVWTSSGNEFRLGVRLPPPMRRNGQRSVVKFVPTQKGEAA
jgi:hypothetical protein